MRFIRFIFYFLLFLIVIPTGAKAYTVALKFEHDPSQTYEQECPQNQKICQLYFSVPFICPDPAPKTENCSGNIEVGIGIKDDYINAGFTYKENILSTTWQGWNHFNAALSDFTEPQKVKLYIPNPAIQNDPESYPQLLVIRPPNAYVTTVYIGVKK